MLLAAASNHFMRRSAQAVAAASRTAAQCATDAVRNGDAVRAMGMLGIVQRRAVLARETANALWLSARRYPVRMATISKFVRQGMQLGVLALAAYLVINNETSPGVMVASTLLLSRAMAPIDSAIAQWHTMTEARWAYRRLVDGAAVSMPSQAMPLTGTPTGALSVDAVSLSMGNGPTILKQVAFRLSPGEFLGIVGPTGAGKSMMARLLVGALAPTDGYVRLDGAELQAWHPDQLGGHVGYLPQDVQLFDGTVAENIARLGDPVREHENVVAAARKAGIHEVVLAMPHGYDTPIGSGGYTLSGGMRQQVALARAFFRNPKLVVLDEPNANLDAHGELALISAIEAVSMAGATLVVITHRPSLLRRANKVLVLQRGRVVEYGTREQVLAKFERAGRQPGALAPVRATEASST
jgi:PrtD family type I secretion system ABC transporter